MITYTELDLKLGRIKLSDEYVNRLAPVVVRIMKRLDAQEKPHVAIKAVND